MRALAGRIPRAFGSHKSPEGWAYGSYLRAKIARLGPLPGDARPWLREAGLIVLALGRLQDESAAAQAVLTNGAGRRARDKARHTIRQLERRAARLRLALADAEARLEALAGERRTPTLAEAIAEASRNGGGA